LWLLSEISTVLWCGGTTPKEGENLSLSASEQGQAALLIGILMYEDHCKTLGREKRLDSTQPTNVVTFKEVHHFVVWARQLCSSEVVVYGITANRKP
jgi:hypothetical protein